MKNRSFFLVILIVAIFCTLPISGSFAQFNSQAIAINNTFSTASTFSSPTPSPSPSSSPTPSPSPSPSPSTGFNFPSCTSFLLKPGDKAHYPVGKHQIVDGPLLEGSDDVYSLSDNNFMQCYCPPTGSQGTQTNWLRTDHAIDGWFFLNGAQWDLGNFNYAAQNLSFNCQTSSAGGPEATQSATSGGF